MVKRMVRVLLLLVALAGCDSSEKETLVQTQVVDCDAALTSCHTMIDGGEVSLSLGPEVVVLKPFAITMQIRGMEISAPVTIDFQMEGMEMGLNRYRLLLKQGAWQGTATLPVCSVSRMDWVAVLEFRRAEISYRLRFPFTTQ